MKLDKTLINLIIILFIYLVLINFLNGSHIYNFIWQTDNIFQDLIMPVKWLECHKAGQDIFISDDCAGGTFAYGPIFLTLPINESLKIFYLNYLPYISIFLFVAFVVLSIKKKNLLSYVLIFFCIFNPSTLLLLQRMNIDIIIFLLLIFLSFNLKPIKSLAKSSILSLRCLLSSSWIIFTEWNLFNGRYGIFLSSSSNEQTR